MSLFDYYYEMIRDEAKEQEIAQKIKPFKEKGTSFDELVEMALKETLQYIKDEQEAVKIAQRIVEKA